MDEINKIWPQWHEDCVIGEGSYGKVYRAKSTVNGRAEYSAVKVISVPKTKDEIRVVRNQGMGENEIYSYFKSLADNLLNEISLMIKLRDCENVVRIDDYAIIEHHGDIGWDIFIRMEMLISFEKFISNPNMSLLDIIKLGIDISNALIYCEQNRIIHRDIKPDNIFISTSGVFKLGDFGIARKIETSTANMSRKGTLNYMAPEIYKGEKYSSNIDIYSLGLVLFTLLNNNRVPLVPPYPQSISYEDSERALVQRLSGVGLNTPCNADPVTACIISKACEYLPQNRYQSAIQFRDDLVYAYNYVAQNNLNCPVSVNHQPVAETNSSYESVEEPEIDVGKGRGLRIISLGASLLTVIFALYLLIKEPQYPILQILGMMMIPVAVLFSRENNVAVGLCCCFAFLPEAAKDTIKLIDLVRADSSIDYIRVVGCIAAFLIIIGGIAGLNKKSVRNLGMLGIYGIVAIALKAVLDVAITKQAIGSVVLLEAAALFCIVMFGFGFNSGIRREGISKVLKYVAFAPSIGCIFFSVVEVLALIKK